MCGVYYFSDEMIHNLQSMTDEIDERILHRSQFGDIHPTDYAPVLVSGSRGIKLQLQRWGYRGIGNNGVIFNARSETVMDKRMFANGIRYHRAAVPVKHFYEWSRNKEKNIFTRGDGDILYLAGFYDLQDNEDRFVILTTEANASMEPVHNRMPFVLEKNQVRDWILDDRKTKAILSGTPLLLHRETPYEQLSLFD